MFGRLKARKRLAETRNLIEDALKEVRFLGSGSDPDKLATKLTMMLSTGRPDFYDGSPGKNAPHVVAGAAAALAVGLASEAEKFDEDTLSQMHLALGNLLLSASTHSATYGFRGYDVPLLKVAEQTYLEREQRTRAATDAIVSTLGL